MYRLLIVDDEPIIVEGLFDLFQKNKYLGLDIYKAYSGEEALQLMNRARIDIILTDISMPGFTGIQLMEEIQRKWPLCRVILLTAYNEFEYVYTAIKHEGVNYLLKTESDAVVVESVEKAIHDLDEVFETSRLIDEVKNKELFTASILKKEYLSNLLNELNFNFDEWKNEFEDLKFQIRLDKPFLLAFGKLDEKFVKLNSYEIKNKLYSLCNFTESNSSQTLIFAYIIFEKMKIVWFIQPKEVIDGVNDEISQDIWKQTSMVTMYTLEFLQEHCEQSLSISMSFVISKEPIIFKDIQRKFEVLQSLLNYSNNTKKGVIMIEDESGQNTYKNEESQLYSNRYIELQAILNKLDILEVCLLNKKKEEFSEVIIDMLTRANDISKEYRMLAAEVYSSLSLYFISFINRWNLKNKLSEEVLNKLMSSNRLGSTTELTEFFTHLGTIIMDSWDENNSHNTLKIISFLKYHIASHLNGEISLVALSEIVHFNPSYLSRLFKQVTGISLSDYILTERVDKSKKLLQQSSLKVYEIAQEVGFESVTYFTRVFKNSMNMTPQKYRDLVLK